MYYKLCDAERLIRTEIDKPQRYEFASEIDRCQMFYPSSAQGCTLPVEKTKPKITYVLKNNAPDCTEASVRRIPSLSSLRLTRKCGEVAQWVLADASIASGNVANRRCYRCARSRVGVVRHVSTNVSVFHLEAQGACGERQPQCHGPVRNNKLNVNVLESKNKQ